MPNAVERNTPLTGALEFNPTEVGAGVEVVLTNRDIVLAGVAPNNLFRDDDGDIVASKTYSKGVWHSEASPEHRVTMSQVTITAGNAVINNGIGYGDFEDIDGCLVLWDEINTIAAVAFNVQIASS